MQNMTQLKKDLGKLRVARAATLGSLLLAVLFGGCASKTPYAQLSEKVAQQADIARRHRLQPLPSPQAYLGIGDIVAKTSSPEIRGNTTYYVDSFDVVTSPSRAVTQYKNPSLPGVTECLVKNYEDALGAVGEEDIEIKLDGKTLVELGAGYQNAALESGGKALAERGQILEFKIPLKYVRPSYVQFDRALKELQEGNYSALKRGCDDQESDNNFVKLRADIKADLLQARSYAGSKKLYIIESLAWSDTAVASLKDTKRTAFDVNAKLDLAKLATGAIGVPTASAKYDDKDENSVVVKSGRTHWGYIALPLMQKEDGSFVVNRNAQPLLLSPNYTKVASN